MKKRGRLIIEAIIIGTLLFILFSIIKNKPKDKMYLAYQDNSLVQEAKENNKLTEVIYEIKDEGDKFTVRISLDGKKYSYEGLVEVIETYNVEKGHILKRTHSIFNTIKNAEKAIIRHKDKYRIGFANELDEYYKVIYKTKEDIIKEIHEEAEANNYYIKYVDKETTI